MSFIGIAHCRAPAARPLNYTTENIMFIKPTRLILIVTALFTAVAWSSIEIGPDALRMVQADLLSGKLELHRHFARGQASDAEENASDGPIQEHQIGHDGIFIVYDCGLQ
jgi:hypothetical protein